VHHPHRSLGSFTYLDPSPFRCCRIGGGRYHLAFRVEGTTPALSTLATLATLTLVLPTFTSSTPGPTLSLSQLVFVGIVSLVLYAVFVFVQTVRHREYFLPVEVDAEVTVEAAVLPSGPAALASFALLFLSLIAVVGLAKTPSA
jgi:Ca2+:H+ antiporter